ncbi:hypothetical protein A3A03_00255 [Candidatus Nomurabacteria bacterium RIFCSPLOWO2_01_FULL_40_18]|uniref:DUF4430 domain-containing protein n=1 Tax=Candidatus Nomurabacteria bacterium RIFCSPLOWO2_01_FULL_40_18 TaxID=1801773 RepID=A0A1F6XK45_9BACT|nr:MAG: hypothetical protein A3A03_00255 [Candidatus Nomurabacteria bacterium RIFCSPLOWO2_01_FULL_40_18]
MFFKNQTLREFLSVLGLILGSSWASALPAARLAIGLTSTGIIRIVATINPTDSGWELQISTDGGKTWTIVIESPVIIGQGRLKWDLPNMNNISAKFRLKLLTDAVIQVPNNLFFQVQSGQTLFMAMEKLKVSRPSFKFESVYKSDLGGQFITEINGSAGEWVFELNGQRIDDNVDVGSSLFTLKQGDEVKWLRRS